MNDDQPALDSMICGPLWAAVKQLSASYLVLLDRDGRIVELNRAEAGHGVEEIVGHCISDFLPTDQATEAQRLLERVFTHGETHSFRATGRWLAGGPARFVVRVGPIMVAGKVTLAMACADDVLPLEESEASLGHERQVLRQLITIQEQERQLISYEIHDGLAQYLTGAMLHLQAYQHATATMPQREGAAGEEQPADAREHHQPATLQAAADRNLAESLRLLRSAVDESRRLISGLRPPVLDELGIIPAIEALVAELRQDGIEVAFRHVLPKRRFPVQVETTLFRIVQELLTNVRKHAVARHCAIDIDVVGNDLHLTVSDDGVGFDPGGVAPDRFGLEGIRQRARLLGREVVISSQPGQGTRAEVFLPKQPEPSMTTANGMGSSPRGAPPGDGAPESSRS